MKKIALTVAVLALGLTACGGNDSAAENAAANDTAVENAAEADLNAGMDTSENAAGNALDMASNAVENADAAVDNAAEAIDDAADNAN